jgi:hypothetical protein
MMKRRKRDGLEMDFSVHEDLRKQIVFGRQRAVEAVKGAHKEREEKKQSARRQKEIVEEFIGLVSPHQGVVGPSSVEDFGGYDNGGLATLG